MVETVRPLKVVFCWSEANGYMAACWQALARRPNVALHILHTEHLDSGTPNPFQLDTLLTGLSHEMFRRERPDVGRFVVEAVSAQRPDVVVHCGWIFPPYRRLLSAPALARVPMVLGMDSPWRGTLTQRLAWLRLRQIRKRFSTVVVAGERSAEYARRIGFADRSIHGGYYGFDDRPLRCISGRRGRPWPRQFLYVGRYAREKDLETLVEGYRLYRSEVDEPWGLSCCGGGPEKGRLSGVTGLTDHGFVQPAQLPEVFGSHGAFVIASRFEPWGVVIAEAAASGLPVVCTTACGAGAELVRDYYNGLLVPPSDPQALARALAWIHKEEEMLPQMGARSRMLAEPYSADAWAVRWHHLLLDAVTASS